jgi:hypothetical protein
MHDAVETAETARDVLQRFSDDSKVRGMIESILGDDAAKLARARGNSSDQCTKAARNHD